MPNRIIKSLVCGITTIAASVAMLSINAFAEEQNLDISINYDTNIEYPLSMDRSSEVFYFNGNINPGDKMHASILVKNTSNQDMQYALTDVVNMITEDEQAIMLLDVLNLKISTEDAIIFEGKCSEIVNPVSDWVTLKAGDSDTISIDWEFDKYADNTYQGANYREKWIFKTKADVASDGSTPPVESIPEMPPATVTTTVRTHENVQTGVKEENDSNYAAYIIGAGVIIAMGYVAYEIIKAKKKTKDK